MTIFQFPSTLFSVLIILLAGCTKHHENKSELTIIFTGDLLLDRGVRTIIDRNGIESLINPELDSVFESSEIVVANLECPVTRNNEPINKKFIFRAEPEWLSFLKKSNITHLNLANNHSMDQGRDGLIDTYNNIKKTGMVPVGYGINHTTACDPLLLANTPRPVYLLSSLRVPSENWPFLANKPCVCEYGIDEIITSVKKIINLHPDAYIITQLHWGIEHTLVPSLEQKQSAYALIDAGVDCIIGHHSHTVQSIEIYKHKSIYYGLGNFIFDQTDSINTTGMMVKITIAKNRVSYENINFIIDNCRPRLK